MVTKVPRAIDAFLKSNASFPYLRGMVIEGIVFMSRESDKFCLVDIGYKNFIRMPKAELEMPGKVLKTGVTRRFVVEHTNNYLGEFDLNMSKILEEQRQLATWNELRTYYEKNLNVMGRVLNNVNGGYAVGIAGHVAFLPKTRSNKSMLRPGKLLPFQILRFNDTSRNMVVGMPGVTVFSRENRGKEPTLPEGGWTAYLRSMRGLSTNPSASLLGSGPNVDPQSPGSNTSPEQQDVKTPAPPVPSNRSES
eukprot:CAMPEP_0114235146 /NCGR_PEP_ID=MMETSP0058-20121206/6089_1 /TAXON_ID=36894 /ORGANISM="Pyramimonas parkeae, CCMP726" /LENGTH=249 /DNA_ID=CAMNT_0001346877 /DNA_START=60 /DNA_END=809 /DNA_ORIENTATION=-